MSRIRRDHAARQDHLLEQVESPLLFVGLARDRTLKQHTDALMIERGDQHQSRLVDRSRPPQSLAVDRNTLQRFGRRITTMNLTQPSHERRLKRLGRDRHQHVPQRTAI